MKIFARVALNALAVLSLTGLSGCAMRHHQEPKDAPVMCQQKAMEMQQRHQQLIQSIEETKAVIAAAQGSKSTQKMKEALAKALAELQMIEDKMAGMPHRSGTMCADMKCPMKCPKMRGMGGCPGK